MLHGGLKAWEAAGQPLSSAPATPQPARFAPQPLDAICIPAEEVLMHVMSGNITVLDVRDATEYAGKDETACCARRGHIPRAVWLEWTELLDASSGKFRSPQDILSVLAARGVRPSATLVPYCHRGARSANTYYALRHAGCPSVRNFIGSFHEWSAREEFPIETGAST